MKAPTSAATRTLPCFMRVRSTAMRGDGCALLFQFEAEGKNFSHDAIFLGARPGMLCHAIGPELDSHQTT
jgi:hypothetical protein